MNIYKMSKPLVWLVLFVLIFSPTMPVHSNPAPNTTKTIVIWTHWADPLPTSISQAYTEYTNLHPDINFQFYFPVDLLNELDAAFAGGTAPDIIVWANDVIGSRVMAGQIVDLRTLGVTETGLKSVYEHSSVEAGKLWGGIYGIPHTTEAIALVYNKAYVTTQYLPTDPMDFETFLNKAQQYWADTGHELVCNQGLGLDSDDAYHAAPVFFGYGVPNYIDSFGHVYANIPAAINAGNWIKNFHQVSDDYSDYTTCKIRLINGETGMWWTGPWAIPELVDQNVNYGIVPMGKPFVGVRMHMITTAAIQRGNGPTALDVINFVTNITNSKRNAIWDRMVPANSAALADPEVQQFSDIVTFSQIAAEGVPLGNSPYTMCQWDPMAEAVRAMWANTKTPQNALDDAQTQIEACVQLVMQDVFPVRVYLPLLTR